MKKLYQRTLKGVKLGLFTPTLPKELLNFQQLPLIRLLRVLGGSSLIILLGKNNFNFELHWLILYVACFFGLLLIMYHFYMSIHKIKHILKQIKNGELDVRNSPLDKYASLISRVLFCAKGVCDAASPLGLGLGLMLGADQVLKDGGKEPFFGPLLGNGLNKILPQSDLEHWKDTYLEATRNLNNASNSKKVLNELLNKTTDLADISEDDKKDLFQLLTDLNNSNSLELESAKEKVVEILESKPK